MPPDAIALLTDLLSTIGARPVLTPGRIVPSTVYDADYRVSVICCGFVILHASLPAHRPRLRAAEFKLAQFVAMRPWLLPVLRNWSAAQQSPQRTLLEQDRLRRGFVGDVVHDNTIAFLSVRGILVRTEAHVIPGAKFSEARELHDDIVAAGLFETERSVFSQMRSIKVTESMLEGK